MSRSIYDSRQRWTIIFILVAVSIIIATLFISDSFSKKLAKDERHSVEVWAEAMRLLTSPDSSDLASLNMNLILHIIEGNTTIPVLLCNEDGTVNSYKNIAVPEKGEDEQAKEKNKNEFLQKKVEEFKAKNPSIVINIDEGVNQYLYYDDSVVLKRLLIYPYIQLGVVFVFIATAFLALLSAKKAEQNKVWVGLSKETAHQLGTPISSLIAWVEYLKTKDVDGTYLKEMEKDVKRLETIADRFSKIGSNPDPLPININDSIKTSCEYMGTRISSKVRLNVELPDEPMLVLMNDSLFSWVIENLTKNAVDAMEGQGVITYHVESNGKKTLIDVTDTGKGLQKSKFKTVFNPGYTTKARGWGLGLSLVKRIVEYYPGGKIFVKNSEIGKGTTFRIELKKYRS